MFRTVRIVCASVFIGVLVFLITIGNISVEKTVHPQTKSEVFDQGTQEVPTSTEPLPPTASQCLEDIPLFEQLAQKPPTVTIVVQGGNRGEGGSIISYIAGIDLDDLDVPEKTVSIAFEDAERIISVMYIVGDTYLLWEGSFVSGDVYTPYFTVDGDLGLYFVYGTPIRVEIMVWGDIVEGFKDPIPEDSDNDA